MNIKNLPYFEMKTQRAKEWLEFTFKVAEHIENYTVPQYGDKGKDIASEYTPEYCMSQVEKYLRRFGKNIRPGQQSLDLLKMAHYVQMTFSKLEEKANVEKP
jgi:hypothetical protein